MATSLSGTLTVNDATVCSICFEKFKTPRYLPCKHSFCHECLSSYIVSQCKSTEPRLGFHCPLCREYIPSDGASGKPEDWAGLFPRNDILQKMIDKLDIQFCEPCLRDNDHEEALNYCLQCNEYLCKLCTKYHKKSMASLDHRIFKISEMESIEIVPKLEVANICHEHQNEKVQLYCHDHEQPCCALCGGTEHRKCEKVDTLENAVRFLKESGEMDSILNKIKTFKKRLLNAKTRQEKNVSEIESTVDENIAKNEKIFLDLAERLDKMKTVYTDEMCSNLKKGKAKLQSGIEKFEDALLYVSYCESGIEQAKGSENLSEAMVKFITAKEKFQKISNLEFKEMYLKICAVESPSWRKFMELKNIAEVEYVESFRPLDFDIRNIELTKCKEITIKDGMVYNGFFLPEKRFLIIDYKHNGPCLMYDENWESIHVNDSLGKPYDATRIRDELYITDVSAKTIEVFALADFQKLRSIDMHHPIYGITNLNDILYIACGDKILKVDDSGHVLQNYDLDGLNTDHIITTNSGLIVYSNWCLDTVTAMCDEGQVVWEYRSPDLKYPQELETDSCENLYVTGAHSHNVHVLSSSGDKIRIIEDIQSPYFFKINEDEGIICVCSEKEKIIVYQIASVVDTLKKKDILRKEKKKSNPRKFYEQKNKKKGSQK